MNQAWVGSGLPLPNSAVPVLPLTGPGSFAGAAVPWVTTARMRPRSAPAARGSSGRGAGAGAAGGAATSRGARQAPLSTAAATVAICRGLTDTRPCPIAAAASSVVSAGAGKRPRTAGIPGARSAPKPKRPAAAASFAGSRRLAASCTNAVLQEAANAAVKVMVPSFSASKLWKVRPPTAAVGGQVTRSPGCRPPSRSASAVTTLKVDPGG